MTQTDTSIISTFYKEQDTFFICYRLIHTVDSFCGDDIFSIFLTSGIMEDVQEDFLYDITREKQDAIKIFDLLCHENVTAYTFRDIIYDLLAER